MKYATDAVLGKAVHEHLVDLGIENPFFPSTPNLSKIEALFSQIYEELGIDLTDDSMSGTPRRLAKMYSHQELFRGLDYGQFPKLMVVENSMKFDEMVLERNIKVSSLCEHHAMPISGVAFVAYIPKDKVIGLSKLNRVVDFFSRRPQVQERLTMQIYHTLSFLLGTQDIAVLIQADHMCVSHRGAEDGGSDTCTSKLGGAFRDGRVRQEFLELCKGYR